jgi:hypothetical protein
MSGGSISKQCIGARYCYKEEQVLASNVLAQEAITGGIGKQCAGARRNYREERVLASNALALDATIGGSRYWQAMCWR